MPIPVWPRAIVPLSAVVFLVLLLSSPSALGSEAKAFTSAGTSLSGEVHYEASGPDAAFPQTSLREDAASAVGIASVSSLPATNKVARTVVIRVEANAASGGDDNEIGGFASASASWRDLLRFNNPFIEPPTSFLDLNAVFHFHLTGSIDGAPGAANCSYRVTIDRTNYNGDHLQFTKGGSIATLGSIDTTVALYVPVDLFILGLANGQTNQPVYPVFTVGMSASARSLYEPSEASKWVGDGSANFGHTFALDAIYYADKHGNPVSGFEDIQIVGDSGPYLMGLPPGGVLQEMVVLDRFGRRLNEQGVTLVDWEGEIANPAIRLLLVPPGDSTFPATATISCPEQRLYFDEPSANLISGGSKTITFTNSTPQPLLLSIFPDRDGTNEDWPITLDFASANGATRTLLFNAHVIDQDQPARPVDFPVIVDFSRDRTGFFDDESVRRLYQQLADDWAYFFADPGLDPVAEGAETTFIWNPTGFIDGTTVTNTNAYRGYLLYAYGIDQEAPPYRSGGEPSNQGGFLSAGGTNLNLRRSGGQELEVKGNYNTLGWDFLPDGPDDSAWWMATNLGDQPNDLASIPHHEMGHALIFNPAQPAFASYKSLGAVQDARVLAYQGVYPAVDASDHLAGTVDRMSGKGAFGNEYYGAMPAGRWLITKLDLLVAQAIGYPLRETSPFVPVSMVTKSLARGILGDSYAQTLQARGGVPFYEWSISQGSLPPGVKLNSFTGAITGIPTGAGTFDFVVKLQEYDELAAAAEAPVRIEIGGSRLEITNVRRTNATVELSYRTLVNHTYRVEYSEDLQNWATLGQISPGNGDVMTSTDPTTDQQKRFYRVVEL